MKRWEYALYSVFAGTNEEKSSMLIGLNEMGYDGWELVSCTREHDIKNKLVLLFLLKRATVIRKLATPPEIA